MLVQQIIDVHAQGELSATDGALITHTETIELIGRNLQAVIPPNEHAAHMLIAGRQRQVRQNRRSPFQIQRGPPHRHAWRCLAVKALVLGAGQLTVDIGDAAQQAQVRPQFAKGIEFQAAILLLAIDAEAPVRMGDATGFLALKQPGSQAEASQIKLHAELNLFRDRGWKDCPGIDRGIGRGRPLFQRPDV